MNLASLPLNALKAFDATARHLSLTRAAEELNVTPGAVGRQVHSLEERLGVRLLRRDGSRLLLTEAGQVALPKLRRAFEELCAAVDEMTLKAAKPFITMSVDPSFAGLWLAPRLREFRNLEPSCDIRIVSPVGHSAHLPEHIDIAITYSDSGFGECDVRLLHREKVSPVCSPTLLRRIKPLKVPPDLIDQPLIHIDNVMDDDPYPGWRKWFLAHGVEAQPSGQSTHVSLAVLAIQAAMADQGLALLSSTLADQFLNNEELVAPLNQEYTIFLSRYIVSHRRGGLPIVQEFKRWILSKS